MTVSADLGLKKAVLNKLMMHFAKNDKSGVPRENDKGAPTLFCKKTLLIAPKWCTC